MPQRTRRSSTPRAAPVALTLQAHLRTLFPTAKNQTLKQMVAGRTRLREPHPCDEALAAARGGRRRAGRTSDRRERSNRTRRRSRRSSSFMRTTTCSSSTSRRGCSPAPARARSGPRRWRSSGEYVEATSPEARIGLIHRLDRDAGGLLVFSKSDLAYQSLKTQFFKHTVERVYQAVVRGTPNPKKGGSTRGWSSARTARCARPTSTPRASGRSRITKWSSNGSGQSTLRVTLHTGRKHQIRVHLSERGWPIVGRRRLRPRRARRAAASRGPAGVRSPADGAARHLRIIVTS